MQFETLQFEQTDNVGVLTLNRPAALNALNQQLLSELNRFIDQIGSEKKLRCLIITGSGEKSFVAGADIKEMENHSRQDALKMAQNGQSIFTKIENLPFATIAAVNGFALGGGLELAMSCDFIVASDKARLGLPEVSLGLIPGYGGTQRLSRYIGTAKARMMIMTGDMFSALDCYHLGLVAKVVSAPELMAECKKMAITISKRSPSAIQLAKRAVFDGVSKPLLDALGVEAHCFAETFSGPDHTEGIKAFLEKRSPVFKGL